MKRLTHEWIAKAEEDFVVAEWLTQAPVASPAAVGIMRQNGDFANDASRQYASPNWTQVADDLDAILKAINA